MDSGFAAARRPGTTARSLPGGWTGIGKNLRSRHAEAGKKARSGSMRAKPQLEDGALAAIAEAPPHYHGHRKRLRARFRQAGAQGLAEYELLELVLFRALPRRDVK